VGAAAGDNLILKFFSGHALRPAGASWAPQQTAAVAVPNGRQMALSSIRVFRLPTRGAEPFDVALSPDGSVWFTEFAADKIGRINGGGVLA
jgi:virginiamycin B lyase